MVMKKQSLGRQKIAIAKIPKKNHLQVTFSKRRAGLFKKASELCTLCGVEIAIIVFSPATKAFSFGHPEVESILDRFLSRNSTPDSGTHQLLEEYRNANVRELNIQLTQLLNQLEIERKRGEKLNQIRKVSQSQCWWETPIEKLGFQELEQLKFAMEELKKNVTRQVNKILVESTHPSPFLGVNGVGHVGAYETKPKDLNVGSTMSHAYNPGYGHKHF